MPTPTAADVTDAKEADSRPPAFVIRIGTKSDLLAGAPAPIDGTVMTSSITGRGIEDVWSAIDAAVVSFQLQEAVALGVVLNQRHLHKLQECRAELLELIEEVEREQPGPEIVATVLSSITARLGEVSGREFTEQVLGEIFSRFCVGK